MFKKNLPTVEKILSSASGKLLYPSLTKLTNPDLVVFNNLNPFTPAVTLGAPCFPSTIALKIAIHVKFYESAVFLEPKLA